ncbi:PAS domain S-box protein [Streptomyces sp. T1317-0309]|nr:PAS domain S-box protein [Streptomyces sp. T1317-0309]
MDPEVLAMPSGDVLILIDEAGRVVEWGHAAEELFGWSAEEAVGRHVSTLVREGADDTGRRRGIPDAAAVLVRPVLRGARVTWEVRTSSEPTPEQDAAILKTLFAHSPTGLHVLDDRLRVVRTSTPGLRDTSTGRLLGTHFTRVYDLEDPERETAVAQGVLDSGAAVVNRLVRSARTPGGTKRRVHSVSYVRLEDSRGQVLGLVASTLDVTDRENARDRLDLLNSVRARVRHGPNVGAVCQEFVEVVVPAFAGIAVVEVIDDVVRGEEPPLVPVREDIPLRRAAFHGGSPAHPMADVRPPPAGTPFRNVLSDLRPRLVPIGEDNPWPAADPARAEAIRRAGAHSLIVAPLALRDRALAWSPSTASTSRTPSRRRTSRWLPPCVRMPRSVSRTPVATCVSGSPRPPSSAGSCHNNQPHRAPSRPAICTSPTRRAAARSATPSLCPAHGPR